MDYISAGVIAWMIIISVNQWWEIKLLTELLALVKGAKVEGSPAARVIPQLYNMIVKQAETRKIKNLDNTPVVQDVDQSLVQIMARYILAELDTKLLDEVDLSETKWIRRGEWKNVTNKTPEQWRAVMDRLEDAGIVERKGAKRTRVLSASKRPSTEAKLKAVVNNSPSIH